MFGFGKVVASHSRPLDPKAVAEVTVQSIGKLAGACLERLIEERRDNPGLDSVNAYFTVGGKPYKIEIVAVKPPEGSR